MRPGDRLFCALLKPLNTGDEFQAWPLHITIIPWFRVNKTDNELSSALEKHLKKIEPFKIEFGEENYRFGHQPGKLATLVKQPSDLISVEELLRQYLHTENAWIVDESTKASRLFIPHVTNQGGDKANNGDNFTCESIYVIEQMGSIKKVAIRKGF